MLPRNHPDRIQIIFDDRRLVANAGLLLPAASHSTPGLTAPSATDPPTGQPKIPADSCQPGPREFPAAYSLAIPRIAAPADGHRGPCAAMKTVRRPPYPKWNPGYFPCSSLTPLPLSSRRPSVSFGGFGVRQWL